MDCIIKFEGKDVILDYLAEGAANIVYKIRPATAQDLPDALKGVLLRLRKATPSSMPYSETVNNFDRHLAPLFPAHNLVHQALFAIPDHRHVIVTLNESLHRREALGNRPNKRHGIYLETKEENGLLITDMTPRGEEEDLIEFKPKWLLQSPSAPVGARRCRTCALREMRITANAADHQDGTGLCPLDLVRDRGIFSGSMLASRECARFRELPVIFAQVKPLLFHLRDLQARFNQVGLTNYANMQAPEGSLASSPEAKGASVDTLDTRIGMTIRDCILLVRYSKSNAKPRIEVRLADLDMKGNKGRKWAGIEKRLVDGGWYAGTEECIDGLGRSFCNTLRN